MHIILLGHTHIHVQYRVRKTNAQEQNCLYTVYQKIYQIYVAK